MKEKILLFFIIFVFSFLSLICADNIKSGEALTSEITPNRAGIKCIQYEKTEVIVSLKDGSKFKGKILREDLLTITLKSILGEITIHRSDILEIEYIQKEREIYPSLSIKERQLLEKRGLINDPEYLDWRDSLYKARNKQKVLSRIGWVGLGVMGGGLALALYGLFGNDEDAAVLGGITAGVGTGMAIYGFMKSGDAKDKIDWLMNEGRIKGYVSFHMNPKRQSVGVFYTLIF